MRINGYFWNCYTRKAASELYHSLFHMLHKQTMSFSAFLWKACDGSDTHNVLKEKAREIFTAGFCYRSCIWMLIGKKVVIPRERRSVTHLNRGLIVLHTCHPISVLLSSLVGKCYCCQEELALGSHFSGSIHPNYLKF